MATTTNFGFETPDDTDLVKDGALAMRTLGDDIDERFGNVATYPNQIVNVVSGVSRPVPFAIASGSANVTGSATVTFPASRFTQAPLITANVTTTNGTRWGVSHGVSSTSSVTLYNWNGSSAGTVLVGITWVAIQMTSATAAG